MKNSLAFFLAIFIVRIQTHDAWGLPLHTESRWIVDESGLRVKLACANWPSHLQTVVAEGLSKQPIGAISQKLRALGFNCVRLTWPVALPTNETLASLTVRQSFHGLGLDESIAGLKANNPAILNLTLIDAFQAVVSGLAENKVMVILDNHLSVPGWCCSRTDGNGFFNDQYFDPHLWIKGLTRMATLFKGQPYVVAMSLRNELRGPNQNVKDWYRYMQRGAEAVHAANPDVLVLLSGLSFDADLSFLKKKPLKLSFKKKLVFEVHWYAVTNDNAWAEGNSNDVCGSVRSRVMSRAGFLAEQGWPLFVSEVGIDIRGGNVNDNRFFNCFLAWAAEHDLDWGLWALTGSYYLREGVMGMEEYYGVLDWNWCGTRNATFMQRISLLQSPLKGPGVSSRKSLYKVMFHPATGLCVVRKTPSGPLQLGPCSESEEWEYTAHSALHIKPRHLCLHAVGTDLPVKPAMACSQEWITVSKSHLHLSTKLADGTRVCLDVGSNNQIVTASCRCLAKDKDCDPQSQWFKIIEVSTTQKSKILV